MSTCVKEIGHRQVYDILQSRKPRATGGGLWIFRVRPDYKTGAAAARTCVGGRDGGRQGRCSAQMLAAMDA